MKLRKHKILDSRCCIQHRLFCFWTICKSPCRHSKVLILIFIVLLTISSFGRLRSF